MCNLNSFRLSFAIVSASRLLGIIREFLVAVAFGFSRTTDVFYMVTFPLTASLSLATGPFTTAFSALLNRAKPELRRKHVINYLAWCLPIGLVVSILYILFALAAVTGGLLGLEAVLVALIIAPAPPALVYIGYQYAVSTSSGRFARSAALLLVLNAAFVIGLGAMWIGGIVLSIWTLPALFSFSAAAAWLVARQTSDLRPLEKKHAVEAKAPLPALGFTLALAGAEAAFFFVNQFLVMWLASEAGEGWVSAASLAQRICLTLVGLVMAPIGARLMLTILNDSAGALRKFNRTCAFSFSLIVAFAITLSMVPVIFAESAQELLTNRSSAEIVGELLLPYSVWMISMGMNAVLSRVMFGLGLEKNFTLITLVGYAVANLARVASFGELEFAWAVLLGALVEILFSTVLFYSVRRRLVAVARAAGPAGDTP